MTSGSERPIAGPDEPVDALPRTDVDLEAELEALRDFVSRGFSLMNHRLFIDLEEFETRAEQVLALLPKEIRRARKIVREEQRLIQDAREEARRLLEEARAEAEQIVTAAREEAERQVEASAIRQRALEQAEAILSRAQESAHDIREKSYSYARQVVTNVETSLNRLTQSVQQDRAQLEQMRPDDA